MGLHMWEPKVYGLPHHWTSTSQLSPIHSIATTLYFIKNNPLYNLQVQKLFEHYNSTWHVTDYFLIWPALSRLCNQCNLCIHNLILETTFVALLQKKLLADFCKNSHSLQVLLARSVQINVCYKISFLKDVPKWACGFVGCGQHTLSESSGYIFIPNSKIFMIYCMSLQCLVYTCMNFGYLIFVTRAYTFYAFIFMMFTILYTIMTY